MASSPIDPLLTSRPVRLLRTLAYSIPFIVFVWLVGENYALHQQNDALSLQLYLHHRQLNEHHTQKEFSERLHLETETRIKEARRIAKQRGYQKISEFLAAVEQEHALQKTNDLYLVVSLSKAKLTVKRGQTIVKEYVVSTGSEKTITKGDKKWIFETPRGVFPIQDKKENPVWVKPDWAFVEANEPIPPLDSPKRRMKGDLGKYGLYLGQGYIIHGTPPEREPLIGLNLSHGCIRMVEQDLKEIYDTIPIGTKVVIR